METNLQCPWSAFAPATIEFCERRLCAWITEPANTWSNVAYLVVGILVIVQARRHGYRELQAIGWIAIALSFGSTWFHATSTFLGEIADLGMMYFFANFAIGFNLWRLTGISKNKQRFLFWVLSIGAVTVQVTLRAWGIPLFVALVTTVGVLEVILWRRSAEPIQYKYLHYLMGMFAVSFLIWELDLSKLVCDPDNHILSGHAVWHLTNAWCFYFLYLFYRQFLPSGKMITSAAPE